MITHYKLAIGKLRLALNVQRSERGERLLGQMDLVNRDAFEAVKAMAVKAREENEALAGRIAALEAELAALKAR